MTTETRKKLATSNSPTIEAVTGQLLRLATEQQAIDWLAMLEKNFVTSKHQIDEKTKRKSLILWIKDYEVTKEEKQKGFLGNFAAITYKQQNNKWTLYPTKMYIEAAHHPQRKYQNDSKHPNWGHPILRSIQKKKSYKNFDEAQADLMKLHEQFPTASIPAKKRFYLMIFSREINRNKPISKYVFEIKVLPEGGFFVDYKVNDYNQKSPKTARQKDIRLGKARKDTEKKQLLDKLAKKGAEELKEAIEKAYETGPETPAENNAKKTASAKPGKTEKTKPEKPGKAKATKAEDVASEPKKSDKSKKGYFTSMVELKRKRRK